jgi:hypothetical protein
MFLFSFFISYFLSNNKSFYNIIFKSFLIVYLFLFLDSTFQFIFGFNIFGWKIIDGRISSFFGKKLVLGSFIARTLPILLSISFLVNFKLKKYFYEILFIMSAYMIVLSGERVAFFMFLIICFFFFIFNKLNFKKIISYILILTTFIFLFFFLKPSSYNRIVKHTLFQAKENYLNYGFLSILTGSPRHNLHIITAYNMFLDKKLFGQGVKSFRYLCDNPEFIPNDMIEKFSIVKAKKSGYFYQIKYNNNYYVFIFEKKIDLQYQDIYSIIINNLIATSIDNHIFSQPQLIGPYNGTLVDYGSVLGQDKKEYVNGCNTHPHNTFFQIISELGLVGFLFYLISLYFVIKLMIFSFFKKKCAELYFICLAILIAIFPFYPSGNLFNNWLLVLLFFKVGLLMSFYNNKINYKK